MMEKKFSFSYHEFGSADELSPADKSLLMKARNAVKSSYAPYSGYHVGAAVLLDDGSVFTGSNQENIAFPSTICAERTACFAAAAAKPGVPLTAVAITAVSDDFAVKKPVTPCGTCRQVLNEYEKLYKRKIRVIMAGEEGPVLVTESTEDLLPFSFGEEELQKKKSDR